ncbi:MAG: glycosyltransferase family 2 protein [Candidatus Omnitrophota bacterium]|jgi:glycosyltransferase involved in cell wall biosynthesis|nr:MAG: glycosyltransferase family 2 protein [Candidatus Omnitrophota bacterium]
MKTVSVLIPAKNESETIAPLIGQIKNTFAGIDKYNLEIVVIADHCNDQTGRIALENGAVVYQNIYKPGKGNSLRFGFGVCKGDIIVMLDADGSHQPQDIPHFIEAIEKGSGLAIGSRAKGGSDEYEIIRLFGNAVFTFLVDILFSLDLTDSLNGYKAFRQDIINSHKFNSRWFDIEIELIFAALIKGYRITEVSSHELARQGGRMKSSTFLDGLRFLFAIFKWGFKYRVIKILSIRKKDSDR